MNKAELIEALAQRANLSKRDARTAVETLFDADDGLIAGTLRTGERVSISGFGTFEPRERKARTGRNPRTGEEISVPASRTVGFRAGKGLKEAMAPRGGAGATRERVPTP